MSAAELKAKQLSLLINILGHTKKPGTIRTFIIGLIFPEFADILGELTELADITERHKP